VVLHGYRHLPLWRRTSLAKGNHFTVRQGGQGKGKGRMIIAQYVLLILLTVASAYADSRGFIWSDRAWDRSTVDWRAVRYALLGFGFGITTWLLAVKYLKQVGGVGVSAQAMGWFLLTILGVAAASGEFVKWSSADKILAMICVGCFAALVFRTSS
jgi:hypothetical protein